MKIIGKLTGILAVLAIISCKDQAKVEEEAAAEERLELIETMETDIDQAVENIESNEKSLDDSLDALNDI